MPSLLASTKPNSPAERLRLVLLAVLAWTLIYNVSGRLASQQPFHDLSSPWDPALPYWPAAIWIYLSAYALPWLAYRFLATRAALLRLTWAIALATLAAGLCFYLWPGPVFEAPPENGLTGLALRWHAVLDGGTAHNKIPALHVALPGLFAAALAHEGRPARQVALAWAWTALIALSTLFLRQHVLVDLPAALLLIAAAHFTAGRFVRS